jgi:hypothetical protein
MLEAVAESCDRAALALLRRQSEETDRFGDVPLYAYAAKEARAQIAVGDRVA